MIERTSSESPVFGRWFVIFEAGAQQYLAEQLSCRVRQPKCWCDHARQRLSVLAAEYQIALGCRRSMERPNLDRTMAVVGYPGDANPPAVVAVAGSPVAVSVRLAAAVPPP